jgi:hypothetical protein
MLTTVMALAISQPSSPFSYRWSPKARIVWLGYFSAKFKLSDQVIYYYNGAVLAVAVDPISSMARYEGRSSNISKLD